MAARYAGKPRSTFRIVPNVVEPMIALRSNINDHTVVYVSFGGNGKNLLEILYFTKCCSERLHFDDV